MSKGSKPPGTKPKPSAVPWKTLSIIAAVGIATNLLVWFWPRQQSAPSTYPTYPATVVALGEDIFRSNCATCHGAEGGGNPGAGVPALDGSMHAWHHSDRQVAGFIRQGVGNMPAVGPNWSDDEIAAVLAYIKEWWDAEQRAYQAQVSRQNP